MEIYYSPKFAKAYKKLPLKVKLAAEKKEKLFRKNPKDKSLKTHKLTGKLKNNSAFSIDFQYRIIFERVSDNEVWFLSVGTHEIYK